MLSYSRLCDSHRVFRVQFALPPVIKEAKSGVASLLDFGEDDACADGMAENTVHNFHNLLPFRGAEVRDSRAWSLLLNTALSRIVPLVVST